MTEVTSFDPNEDTFWGQVWNPVPEGWLAEGGILLTRAPQGWQCSLEGVTRYGDSPEKAAVALLGPPLLLTSREGVSIETYYPITLDGSPIRKYFSCLRRPTGVITRGPEGWSLEASSGPSPTLSEAWNRLEQESHFWGRDWITWGWGWTVDGAALVRAEQGGWILKVNDSHSHQYQTREDCLAATLGPPRQILAKAWYSYPLGRWFTSSCTSGIRQVEGGWTNYWRGADVHPTPEEAVRDLVRHFQESAQEEFKSGLENLHMTRRLALDLGV